MKNNIYVVDQIVRQVVVGESAGFAAMYAADNSNAYIEENGFIHSPPVLITNINSLPPDIDKNTVPINSQQTIVAILGVK